MAGVLAGRERKYTTDLFPNIVFCSPRRPDIFGSAYIEDKKNCLFFFFPESFDKSSMPFRGNIPVDGADVISVLIGAYIIEFKSGAFEDGVEISLHLAVDRLADLDLVLS